MNRVRRIHLSVTRRLRFLLALAAGGVLAHTAAAAEPTGFLPDADVLNRAPTLSIDEQRYLVYLYARLNKPKVAEKISEFILKANPSDRQTLLVLASMYVEQKDAQATLQTARAFLKFYPGDHQGRYFLGAGHYLAREFADANRVLRDLKHEQFSHRKYPYETDLAASAYAAGDWYRAMLSYQELLRNHELGDELRSEVREVLDSIYREHLPRWEITASNTRLERAEVWRYGASNAQHLSDRHWFEVRYSTDKVELEAAPGLVATEADRSEIAAQLTSVHQRRFRTDMWAGLSREGAFAGARLHVVFAKQREMFAELAANVRAVDSLTLEALDGRQRHAAVNVSWLVEADLTFSARANVREVFVARERLGQGAGVDFNLDYTLWRQGPKVIVGYRGSIATFSADDGFPVGVTAPIADPAGGVAVQQALASNLVARRINRHGVGLFITDNLADAWVYRLNLGCDYDFELSSLGWNAGLGLTFFPRKSIEITSEAGYTSSANASNAGSAAVLLNFFIRAYY